MGNGLVKTKGKCRKNKNQNDASVGHDDAVTSRVSRHGTLSKFDRTYPTNVRHVQDYQQFRDAIKAAVLPEFQENLQLLPTAPKLIKDSWELIIHGNSPHFKEKSKGDCTLDPVCFFTIIFFKKMFQLVPRSKTLFYQDPHQRYYKLDEVIHLLSKLPLLNIKETKLLFQKVTTAHRRKNVRALWYGSFILTLVREVRRHLRELFSPEMMYAWVSVCSHCNKELLYADFHYLENPPQVNERSIKALPRIKSLQSV